MKWFVVRTKPKNEFRAQNFYSDLQVQTYLATTPVLNRYKIAAPKIVLPSYLFTRLTKLDYGLINSNPYTRDVLKVGEKPAEVSDKEIRLMQKHLSSNFQADDLSSVTSGDIYSIPHGMFSGQTGEIVKKNKNKISLLLHSLSMVITIDLK